MNNSKLIKFYQLMDEKLAGAKLKANVYINLDIVRNDNIGKIRSLIGMVNAATVNFKIIENPALVNMHHYRYYISEIIKENGDKIVMNSATFSALVRAFYDQINDILIQNNWGAVAPTENVIKKDGGDYLLITPNNHQGWTINTNRTNKASTLDDDKPGNLYNIGNDKDSFGVMTILESPNFWLSDLTDGTIINLTPFNADEINWSKCADENKFTVYVIRNDRTYGSFVIPETDEKLFHRCEKSGYLLTGLSNRRNEREKLPDNTYCSRYVLEHLTIHCDLCGRRDFKDAVSDEAKAAGGCNNCLASAKSLFRSAGIDETQIKFNRDFILNPHTFRGQMQFINVENDPNPLFLGVELEVDTRDGYYADSDEEQDEDQSSDEGYSQRDQNLIAQRIIKTLSPTGAAYTMWDGSLQNGFEIATHPATLKSHMSPGTFNYETAFKELTKFNYKSHEAGTCGLHIHINRSFFGKTKRVQNFNAGKMAYLLEKHWNDFVKFSRREGNTLDRWARGGNLYREYQPLATAIDNAPITTQSKTKEKGLHISSLLGKHYPNREKYVALNTQHANTFEFRIFRGTLVYKTFIATLILIDNLARMVKESDIQRLTSISFSDIIKYRDSQILKDYWQTR